MRKGTAQKMFQPWEERDRPLFVKAVDRALVMPVCVECAFSHLRSREDLSDFIKGLRHNELLKIACNSTAQLDHAPELPIHHVVEIPSRLIMGSRIDPYIVSRLHRLDPDLVGAVKRYECERRPLNEEIARELTALEQRRAHLAGDRRLNARRRQGRRRSDEAKETLNEAIARTPELVRNYRDDHTFFQVAIESGMNLIEATRKVARFELDQLDDLIDTVDEWKAALIREELGWSMFSRYIELMSHLPEYAPLLMTQVVREAYPSLRAFLECTPLTAEAKSQLMGDIAVLQFDVHKQTALLQDVRSYSTLFEALATISYPRLKGRKTGENRHRLAMLVKEIAQPLERVVITEMNWEPLFRDVHFSHCKKKPPTYTPHP